MIARSALIIVLILALVAISLTFFIYCFLAWGEGNPKLAGVFLACDAVFSYFAFKVIRAITGR